MDFKSQSDPVLLESSPTLTASLRVSEFQLWIYSGSCCPSEQLCASATFWQYLCFSCPVSVLPAQLRGSSHSLSPDQSQGWDQGTPGWPGWGETRGHLAGLSWLGRDQGTPGWPGLPGSQSVCYLTPQASPGNSCSVSHSDHGAAPSQGQEEPDPCLGPSMAPWLKEHSMDLKGGEAITSAIQATPGFPRDYFIEFEQQVQLETSEMLPVLQCQLLCLICLKSMSYLPIPCSCWDPQATLMIIYLWNPCEAQQIRVQFNTGADEQQCPLEWKWQCLPSAPGALSLQTLSPSYSNEVPEKDRSVQGQDRLWAGVVFNPDIVVLTSFFCPVPLLSKTNT